MAEHMVLVLLMLSCWFGPISGHIPAAKMEAGVKQAKLADILKEMQAYKELYDTGNDIAQEEIATADAHLPLMESDWPKGDLHLGQIGGVSMTGEGHIAVFHRGDTVWTRLTFDREDRYLGDRTAAIDSETVVLIRASDGHPVDSTKDWGRGQFFMPHGLTVDQRTGDYWLTDVAMHQVFKYSASDKSKPSLILGEKFKPAYNNEDKTRFCKPTSISVSPNGDIFVADGYCNSRIVYFNKQGEYISQLGSGYFQIPHSLVSVPELSLLCVADRENMRVLCFDDGSSDKNELGQSMREYTSDGYIGRVFALVYSPKRGVIYAVNGPTAGFDVIGGVTIDLLSTNELSPITSWAPSGNYAFTAPHTMTISNDGDSLYIGETSPNEMWKFNVVDTD